MFGLNQTSSVHLFVHPNITDVDFVKVYFVMHSLLRSKRRLMIYIYLFRIYLEGAL